MRKTISSKRQFSLFSCFILLFTLVISLFPASALADTSSLGNVASQFPTGVLTNTVSPGNYQTLVTDNNGEQVVKAIFPLGPSRRR